MEVLPLRPHLSPLFSTSYHLCVYSNPFASKLQVANYEIYYIIVLQSPYKHRKNAALMSHSPKRRFAFHPFLEWSKYFIQPGKIVISGDHTVNFFLLIGRFFSANLRGLLYSHSSSSESDGSAAEAASVP